MLHLKLLKHYSTQMQHKCNKSVFQLFPSFLDDNGDLDSWKRNDFIQLLYGPCTLILMRKKSLNGSLLPMGKSMEIKVLPVSVCMC